MGKLIQFRCCYCHSLMLKWRIGSDNLDFIGIHAQFVPGIDGKKDIICRKCGTRQQIVKGKLQLIELHEVESARV